MERKRYEVVLSTEAKKFLRDIPLKARRKVGYNISKLEEGYLDKEIFEKLGDTEIWEIRTLFDNVKYRLFAFWDTENEALIIATHGIIKKTQKTPLKEISRAEHIRKVYFETKKR